MKGVFLVKTGALMPMTKDEPPKIEVFNLLLEAISYTDAEAKATEFFEKQLKPKKYGNFSVDKISTESFNRALVTSVDKAEIEHSKVFKIKVTFGFEEDKKKLNSTIIVRSEGLEEAANAARDFVLTHKGASWASIAEAKETVISPFSPTLQELKLLEDE